MALMKKQANTAKQQAANNQSTQQVNKIAPTKQIKQREVNSKAINVFRDSESFADAQRMANALASADFTPLTFRGKMSNCLLALEMSSRMDVSVVVVMQNMHVVNNKPAWSATYIIASINTSGRFKTTLMYEVEKDNDGNINGCYAYVIDKYGNRLEGPKVTAIMVKNEGWLSNPKWTNMPELMYRYRSASFFGKLYTPDILMGMQTIEEIEDVYNTYEVPVNNLEAQHVESTNDESNSLDQQINVNPLTDDTAKPSEPQESIIDVVEDEEIEPPAYIDDANIVNEISEDERPVIENIDDLILYVESLDLTVDIKPGKNNSPEYFAVVNISKEHPYAEEIEAAGFEFRFARYILVATQLMTVSQKDELEAKELFG